MQKLLFLTVVVACILSLSLSEVLAADDALVQKVEGIRFQQIQQRTPTIPQAIEQIKKEGNYEVMDLRLYIRDGKLLVVEPLNPEVLRKAHFLKDLRRQPIREVIGLAIQQESPGCAYWPSFWGWEKICN